MPSLRRSPAARTRPTRLIAEGAVGWLRPAIAGRNLPAPESPTRRWAIRGVAIAAIVVTVAYLAWRTVATLRLEAWWVSVPLLLLEVNAAAGLVLLTFSLWDIDAVPAPRPVVATTDRIAVLIPTLDESLDILTPTVAAALALAIEHETWVLDDGGRPEVARLAADLGARYHSRPEPTDGLAGNLNHALATIDADVIAVLHADSVASPDFLANTLGHLADPRVALVQTPEGFYNIDSFEHGRRDRGRPVHERTLAHRIVQPGRNRWRGAFWMGTGAVIRVAALRDIGGVATGTLAPDRHTTLRLHRNGWDTLAHNEVLARGLAPTTAAIDAIRRRRQATGAMQLLRTDNPLMGAGLSLERRLSHAAALLAWFDAWRWLAIIVLPIAILLTSADPIRAELPVFLAFAGLAYTLQAVAQLALSRGCDRPLLSILLRIVRMTPDLQAVRQLFADRTGTTRDGLSAATRGATPAATPKGRTSDVRRKQTEPRLLRVLATVSVFTAATFALAIMVSVFFGTNLGWASYGAWGWLMVDVILLVRAIGRVRDLRFGGERRASVRFETSFAATFDGATCDVLDVSLRGAGIRVARPVDLTADRLVLVADGRELEIAVAVRSARADETGATVIGLEYLPDQNHVRADLALALFRTTVVETRAGEPAGTRVAAAVADAPRSSGSAAA